MVRCTATLASLADAGPLVARVRRLLDLDADSRAIDEALAADPALAPLVAATPGIRLPGSVDADETLVRTLLGQQVSVAAARTALGRLVEALGDELPPEIATGAITRSFPAAAVIAERGAEVLRGPARRVDTVLRVCALLADGALRLDAGASRDELAEHLLAVPGIGPWTAGYVAMRVTGDPTCC